MKMKITREDFLKGKLLTPGWYNVLVAEIETGLSKKGDSTNYTIQFKILDDGPFKDCIVTKTFNEKAPGVAIPFFSAVAGKEIEPDKDYDFEQTKNRKIALLVGNDTYNNRMVNAAMDFRPAGN
jgi:hypothetical protein